MTNKQKQMLLELQIKKRDEQQIQHHFDILIHSVLNTIEINNLIQIYIDDSFVELKTSIFSNIQKRLIAYQNSETIYENLKFILECGVGYYKSQRVRKVLEILLGNLDDDYKADFFTTFFYSKYSNDKKSATNYITYSKKNIHHELLDEYLNTGNVKFLQPLLNKKYINFLSEHVQEIWFTEPSFFFRKRIIELLSKTKFHTLEFIQNEDDDLYLLACVINKKIKAKEAVEIISKVPEEKRHFSILNLSKVLDFKYLENEIRRIFE